MERQLSQMGTQLGLSYRCGCVRWFLVLGLLRGYGVLEMLKTAISLAVARCGGLAGQWRPPRLVGHCQHAASTMS